MTGYASAQGQGEGYGWSWELRGVNGRGFDLRLRTPDWIEGLEPALRGRLAKNIARGSVTLTLRVVREDAAEAPGIDGNALSQTLDAISRVEEQARQRGVRLRPCSAAEILAQHGVPATETGAPDTGRLRGAILTDLMPLIAAFNRMRATEGVALSAILTGQLCAVETLIERARKLGVAGRDRAAAALQGALARVLENSTGAAPDRIAQELALIAVKTDVTEELDRLSAHIAAARDLLATERPVGRKLDFLMQECNREANTLCSKSQFSELTRIGLDLKVAMDQMREQVQNVE